MGEENVTLVGRLAARCRRLFGGAIVLRGGFQHRNRLQRLECGPQRRSQLERDARLEVRRTCTGVGGFGQLQVDLCMDMRKNEEIGS